MTVIEKAVTDHVGNIAFFLNSDNSAGNALWDPGAFPGNDKSRANPVRQTVPVTTLDARVSEIAPPTLMKMDTEGAEQRVLEGAGDILASRRWPFVITELHEFGLARIGCTQDALRGFMERLGYSTFCLSFRGALPKLIPAGTRIQAPFIINLLLSTPEKSSQYWPVVTIDPRTSL